MKKNWLIVTILLLAGIFTVAYLFLNRPVSPSQEELASRKTVGDYFVEHMRVDYAEAKEMASDGVILRLSENSTAQGVVGNLYYYSFIDDERKFEELLETTPDLMSGNENSIKVGSNTIDVNSNYYLSYDMTDEKIAETLLNKAEFEPNFTQYNYLFMPSGKIREMVKDWENKSLK